MTPKLSWLLWGLLGTLALDQGSKIWVVKSLAYRGPPLDERAQAGLAALGHAAAHPAKQVVVPGWLAFEHSQNPAAAMGLMLGYEHRYVFFALFTLVATAALLATWRALAPGERLQAAGLGVLLGGALGNGIDRLHKGTVTDFVEFTAAAEPFAGWMRAITGSNVWYTFNVADAAIFVGIGLYLLAYFVTPDAPEEVSGRAPDLG